MNSHAWAVAFPGAAATGEAVVPPLAGVAISPSTFFHALRLALGIVLRFLPFVLGPHRFSSAVASDGGARAGVRRGERVGVVLGERYTPIRVSSEIFL